jgi:hypothetical protein
MWICFNSRRSINEGRNLNEMIKTLILSWPILADRQAVENTTDSSVGMVDEVMNLTPYVVRVPVRKD